MIVDSCLGGYRNCFLASSPMRPIIELRPITGRAIWLVGFLSKPWKEVMNISFISIARLLTFDALETVTSKYALSGSEPIPFDWARQVRLASIKRPGS
jgi:hypothetical protein